MKEEDNIIGNNIKNLRETYGETQEELGDLLQVSRGAVSQYENGIRRKRPNSDMCKTIAKHYHITVDDLLNRKFPEFPFSIEDFKNKNHSLFLTKALFPVVTSTKAEENQHFKDGYEAHLKMIETMKQENRFDEDNFDKCIRNYQKSVNDVIESVANLAGLFIVFESVLKNPELFSGLSNVKKGKISFSEFVKKYGLGGVDHEYLDDSYQMKKVDKASKTGTLSLTNAITLYLKTLAQSEKYKDLAYFDTAVRYLMGTIKDDSSDETNSQIGYEMMKSMRLLGNQYADDYLKACENLRQEKFK